MARNPSGMAVTLVEAPRGPGTAPISRQATPSVENQTSPTFPQPFVRTYPNADATTLAPARDSYRDGMRPRASHATPSSERWIHVRFDDRSYIDVSTSHPAGPQATDVTEPPWGEPKLRTQSAAPSPAAPSRDARTTSRGWSHEPAFRPVATKPPGPAASPATHPD